MRKYALVTGASGAIGGAIAIRLAKEGYSLYLHYNNNLTGIKKLLQELEPYNGEYIPIKADLSIPDGYKKIVSNVFSVDTIIHNSGMGYYGMLSDIDEVSVEKLLKVHVTTPLLLTKELLPKMLPSQSGNIIVISSIWGQVGAACEVAYSAAKGAQISFVKALSKELARGGIRVNAIAPGAVDTPLMSGFTSDEIKDLKEEIPMGRLGVPNDIAGAVNFLLSNDASYITGQVMSVNGGWYV